MYQENYDPASIEKKWQKIWMDTHAFEAENNYTKPKFYGLIEFPYPSGAGLHVGHPRSNTAMDIICRKRRMEGYNVLFPIGWDAFGLPTENYAIKNKVHPAEVTQKNIDHFREQLQKIGFSFDYTREVNTTDPSYFKWTQWIFLQLYKHGLAYKAHMPINWCTSCKCGLANEEVVDGVCERCGSPVIRKVKTQWMLRITAYAQKLLDGLDKVDFIDKVKVQQRNWIGRSEGAEVDFRLTVPGEKVRVYTTRPDTLFGATYMVLSPEHPLIEKLKDQITNYDACMAYRQEAARKSDFERAELNKEKTGVQIEGVCAINPVNGKEIPIWLSDYVLMTYGTGAIMAVPAHDTRDWEFAHKFGLPMVEVVAGGDIEKEAYTDIQDGVMVNTGFLNGMKVAEAKKAIIDYLVEKGFGERKVNYKLRDWVFSRQRYWGEPIPMVHCDKCGMVPVPEDRAARCSCPTWRTTSPPTTARARCPRMTDWVNTTCPCCGGPAKRETDTMPQWAGSSWYFLRYCDPHNDKELASKEALDYWMPGGLVQRRHGAHHAAPAVQPVLAPVPVRYRRGARTGTLSEAHQPRHDSGRERREDVQVPRQRRQPGRHRAGAAARTRSVCTRCSWARSIRPIPWSTNGAKGCRRFLDRVWKLQTMVTPERGLLRRHGSRDASNGEEGFRGLREDEVQHRHRGHDDAGERLLCQGQGNSRRAADAAFAAEPRCAPHHRGNVGESGLRRSDPSSKVAHLGRSEDEEGGGRDRGAGLRVRSAAAS